MANQQHVRDVIVGSRLAPLIECTYHFTNPTIVLAFSKRWKTKTNSFHLSFGEMTIMLDNVVVILKILVTDNPAFVPHLTGNEAREFMCRLLGVSIVAATRQIAETWGPYVKLDWLKRTFMNIQDSSSDEEIHHDSRAYLLFLLGCTLFVDKSGTMVSVVYLALLDNLSLTGTYAWGGAWLAYMYRQLGICEQKRGQSDQWISNIGGNYLMLRLLYIYLTSFNTS